MLIIVCALVLFFMGQYLYQKCSLHKCYKEINVNTEDGKLCVLFLTHYLPCPSCQARRDRLNELYEQYKNNVEFVIVMDACIDPQIQERLFKNMKLLPEKVIITENIAQWTSLGVKTFPSFVLFDKKGNVFYAGTHISETVWTLFSSNQ